MLAGFAAVLLGAILRRKWTYVVVLPLVLYETVNPYRFGFHSWVRDQLIGVHPQPGAKEVLQSKIMYAGSMLGVALLLLLLPYLARAGNGRRLLAMGTLLALGVLALELVSPHRIDRILGHFVGSFTVAAIAYFVASLMMATGMLLDHRR
ncbi:hypothetical protein H7F53_03145 [Novosphingobium piscinae]|uniref:Uncharacterized protein n=2 Tax=Novosphingobium piscinae TaxID=1507448 RepID=A0A7X1FWH7_9SPHN|nr:hypothetical protein [Novosphingobium piscinae]MBC2668139.1 hypothetical protein [Novosphingobium piscinae]